MTLGHRVIHWSVVVVANFWFVFENHIANFAQTVVGFGSGLKLPTVRIWIRVVVSGGVRPVTAEAADSNLDR